MIPIAKPYLTEDEAQAAFDAVMSGWVTQGPRVQELENKFAAYTGAPYAIAVSNCTTALHLAMIVSEIGPGDEVICPSMSYIATANCIRYVGATPVFAEVNPDDYNISLEDAEKKITSRTKAILVVHQVGMPADINGFKELCKKHNLRMIEDAACAVGSSYNGQKIGIHSDLVCFSFHPRKVISTGDGGMITTNRPEYNDRLRLLRQHGMSVNDRVRHESKTIIFEDHVEVGYNYRMTDIQGAVGIKQLEKLDWLISERRKIALQYLEALKDIDCIRLPSEKDGCFSNYQSFCIYLKTNSPISRNDLMEEMRTAGISSRRGIMTTHRETAYKSDYKNIHLPVSEDLADNSVVIPLYIPMEQSDILRVIQTLRSLLSGK